MSTIVNKISFSKKTILLAVAILLSIGFITAAVVQKSAIANQLHEWKLLPQPERLTELYFNEHANLPKEYTPGSTETVSFTVHNLEYELTTYNYEIIQQDESADTQTTLATGSFNLRHNAYHGENTTITYADADPRSVIIVRLINENQSIHYWVERVTL